MSLHIGLSGFARENETRALELLYLAMKTLIRSFFS
jgi:hypothetical protein